jgi:hypothetical protein
MRSVANRQQQLAGLFVVLGVSILFGPVIWLLERWREAITYDPTSAWAPSGSANSCRLTRI